VANNVPLEIQEAVYKAKLNAKAQEQTLRENWTEGLETEFQKRSEISVRHPKNNFFAHGEEAAAAPALTP